jgi:hypothetical protein
MPILYIHGMGGGGDSRIPSILREEGLDVIVRTYDFDPDVASAQIASWVNELNPELVIGESLGALHALRIQGVPKVLVSPALNAPIYFELLAWLTLIPGVTALFNRIYRQREGDRQPLRFTFRTLRKYMPHRRAALVLSVSSSDRVFALLGTRDHYRKSGIVSFKTWEKYFGSTYFVYDGTHFTEEEYVRSDLKRIVLEILDSNK